MVKNRFPSPRAAFRFLAQAATAVAIVSVAPAGVVQDLSTLFAQPTAAEMSAVRADWLSRPLSVESYRLEATGSGSNGDSYHVLSHVVDGQRHYGALRFPQNFVVGENYPVLVLCHGGLEGVDSDETENLFGTFPGECIEADSFILIPSYRGEDLETPFAGTFTSGGNPSWADRDVDDTRALLSAALQAYPEMDEARVAAYGISRGGAVALLLSIRDSRVRRIVDIFGFTDLSLPSVRVRIDRIRNFGETPTGIGRVAWEASVQPWLVGALTLDEARMAWIRRSPCYFAVDVSPIQAHHGLSDTQVDSSHTSALLEALAQAGASPADVEGFFYPGGLHGLSSLPGHGDRVEPFLCALRFGPRGFCGPMSPNSNGSYAAATFSGTSSLSNNDFVFRAVRCPPSSVGLLFGSNRSGYFPGGAGFVCVGPGLQRLGLGLIDAQGHFSLPLNLRSQDANVSGLFGVGSKLHLQVVYRDVLNPSGPYNFSNGLRMMIEP